MTERAAVEGVPVRGCFLWSLLGKFEWADGDAEADPPGSSPLSIAK